MARHKASKKRKGARPPNRLLAMRKQWKKRSFKNLAFNTILYHGATVPPYQVRDKRHREIRDLVRNHHAKKLAVKEA